MKTCTRFLDDATLWRHFTKVIRLQKGTRRQACEFFNSCYMHVEIQLEFVVARNERCVWCREINEAMKDEL